MDLENGRCVHILIPMVMRIGVPMRIIVPLLHAAHTAFPVVNKTMDINT
jgi:hypothetical protein